MNFKQKPYQLLLIAAVLLFICGLLAIKGPFGFRFYDIYFIFPLTFLFWIPSATLFAFWILYLSTNRFLFSKKLMWAHILLTILTCLCLLTFPHFSSYYGSIKMRRYLDVGQSNTFIIIDYLKNIAVKTLPIIILAQLTFLTNLVAGLYNPAGGQNNR